MRVLVVAWEGVEPSSPESESGILPLDDLAVAPRGNDPLS
jgi:hypothetical protein